MKDKQKILAEIERLYCEEAEKYDTSQEIGAKRILDELSKFINSLPAEQPSEDLEEAANLYANKQGLELKPFARRFFIAGAQWQKEQMMKSAIDGEVTKDFYQNLVVRGELPPNKNHDFCFGDKVKIIVTRKGEQ